MVVEITNLTDGSDAKKKRAPAQIAIYTQLLNPGESLKLPAHMVDERLRKLERSGLISIGQVPSWYEASTAKKSTVLTPEQTFARLKNRKPRAAELTRREIAEKKAHHKAAPSEELTEKKETKKKSTAEPK